MLVQALHWTGVCGTYRCIKILLVYTYNTMMNLCHCICAVINAFKKHCSFVCRAAMSILMNSRVPLLLCLEKWETEMWREYLINACFNQFYLRFQDVIFSQILLIAAIIYNQICFVLWLACRLNIVDFLATKYILLGLLEYIFGHCIGKILMPCFVSYSLYRLVSSACIRELSHAYKFIIIFYLKLNLGRN